jgi:hypothetical protein
MQTRHRKIRLKIRFQPPTYSGVWIRRALVGLTTVLLVAPSAAAEDTVGLVDPAAGRWQLRDESGVVSGFFYGNPGDFPMVGDWDCDGVDTPGLYRQSDGFVYLRNSNSQGVADIRFFFGNPGDIPLAGDFDGDGCDTVSIYRAPEARIYVINALGANDGGLGAAEFAYVFGNPGDKPFVGDFDGNGEDTVGLHRESTGFVYFRNSHTQGNADNQFFFGDPGDRLVAGDWGIIDGVDTPAVFRPSDTTFYFRHTNTQGNADSQFRWGSSGWLPVAGEFGALPGPPQNWPTPNTTGFRGAGVGEASLTPSGSIATSAHGQVIDRRDVTGGITVRHDNVTIRNSRINYTGNYGILVEKVNGVCPKNTLIRNVEIDGSLAADDHAPAYDSGCGYTFDHVYLHDSGTGIRLYGSSTITNSYLVNDTFGSSGAHREPLLVRGSNHVIKNNVLICDVPQGGCSAALAIYGDPYPTQNILVEGNWMAATAAYCAYGGATHTYADQAENVDFFDNAFSVSLTPETPNDCGRAGDITAHRNGVDGNQRAGNYIYETGQAID